MKNSRCRFRMLALGGIVLLGFTGFAAAHHSFAMYDQTVELTMTGKLLRFIPGANHAQFVFQPLKEDGTLDEESRPWNVETGPVVSLARQGITVESFPVGTIFTVTLNPLRDGRNGGSLRGDLILCGMSLPQGGCTAETGKVY
jgi:hypothetical protein